jgi:hypothetical protein
VNHIGTNIRKSFLDTTEEDMDSIFKTNLTSSVEPSKLMFPFLKEYDRVQAVFIGTNYGSAITASGNSILSDEPVEIGGLNRGFNPFELAHWPPAMRLYPSMIVSSFWAKASCQPFVTCCLDFFCVNRAWSQGHFP